MAIESRPSRRFLSEREAAPILARFLSCDANWDLFERERPNLLRDHYGEWVAVSEGRFLFSDSLEALIESARAENWPLETTVIRLAAERELTV